MSTIELVAFDEVLESQVHAALNQLRQLVLTHPVGPFPLTIRNPQDPQAPVARYTQHQHLRPAEWEYSSLQASLAPAIAFHAGSGPLSIHRARTGGTPGAPLIAVQTESHDSVSFELTSESARRIMMMRPFSPKAVGISRSVRDNFEDLHGSIYPHIASALTGLDDSELAQLNGIEFRDPNDNRLWPR